MAAGQPAFDRAAASNVLQQSMFTIRLGLGHGSGAGQAWGCDLSDQYVRINTDYDLGINVSISIDLGGSFKGNGGSNLVAPMSAHRVSSRLTLRKISNGSLNI